MSKEREIEELTAHIQKAFDVVKEKFGRAPYAETIASNLYLHRYRREDIVEKETAKAILTEIRQLHEKNIDIAFLSADPALKFYAKGKEECFRIVCEYLVNLIGEGVDE